MQEAQIGKPGGFGSRSWSCMGMSFLLRPAKDKWQEMASLLRAAVESGYYVLRHGQEVYGPFTNEDLVGEALLLRSGKQVIIATESSEFDLSGSDRRPGSGGSEQPARAHQAGRRGLPQAAQDRCHRLALSASGRSECADRRRGGNGQGADSSRQSEALRPLRSGRANYPSR